MPTYKVLIDSPRFDCSQNLIGCSIIYRYLIQNGHEITNDPSIADFIIINSCGNAKPSIELSMNIYNLYYNIKKKNTIIIMFGCLVKIDKKLIDSLDVFPITFEDIFKFDDLFYTKKTFRSIKPYCNKETRDILIKKNSPIPSKVKAKGALKKLFMENYLFLLSRPFFFISKKIKVNFERINYSPSKGSFVEISQGCKGKCSYCVIKKAKGKLRSRNISDIIADIEKLHCYSKNLFLVADDCGCYGADIGSNLIELIFRINKLYPDMNINIGYLNPEYLLKHSDAYIQLFDEVNIRRVLIPMQSGSSKVLKIMNRRYNAKDVITAVDKIKEISPKTLILSHFIAGHPGEKTLDFLRTISVVKHFDYPMPFQYSEHKGTLSAILANKKSTIVILLRFSLLTLFCNLVILFRLATLPVSKNHG